MTATSLPAKNQQPSASRERGGSAVVVFVLLITAGFGLASIPSPAQGEAAPGTKKPVSVRKTLLAMAGRFDPQAKSRQIRARLDVHEIELRERLAGVESGREKAAALATYYFEEQRFSSHQDLSDPSNFYVHRVLESRQGFCLSLSAIILVTAKRLKLPVRMVATPRHVFLRYHDGDRHWNIETTERGRFRSDAFYRERGVTAAAERDGVYLRDLDDRQVVAHLLNNEGFIHFCRGELELAERRFEEALAAHPKLAEAWLNLGVVAAERGDEKAARERFDRARTWLPNDAPLTFNRALSALRAGRFKEAVEAMEEGIRAEPSSHEMADYRHLLLATVLRPDNWRRYQAQVVREGEALRRAGRLASGFRAVYFGDEALTKRVAERRHEKIEFEWRWSRPLAGIEPDDFGIRWDGWVDLPEDSSYSFFLVFEQGVRLWIDGIRFIDHSRGKRDRLAQETIALRAGLHSLRIEYVGRKRPNGVIFTVKDARSNRALPPSRFFHERP